MYELGEKVVYPIHGVGVINSIEDKTVLGEKRSYYIIKLAISDMTVMIPTDKSEQLGLRQVVSSRDVSKALKLINSEVTDMEEDWKEAGKEIGDRTEELMKEYADLEMEVPLSPVFEESFVEHIGKNWIVWIDVHIQEYINGGIVKNLVNRIPMQVVRYDVDREENPWGLALNGPGIYQPKLILKFRGFHRSG